MSNRCPYCMKEMGDAPTCPNCGQTATSYKPSSHHLPPGTRLNGRYEVGRVLGEGGFGITYLGTDTKLEMTIAVKEYFPTSFVKREVSLDLNVTCYTDVGKGIYEKGREQFLQEARTMAKLKGIPQIVRVTDHFEENSTAYIVMDYLEGITLKQLTAEQGRFPAKALLQILEPLFPAMEAMHQEGLIHRDISPDNIMQLKNGSIKLMDFGCARDLDGGRTMTVILKHGYAPVEQYIGHDQGPWTDVYALCSTMYYCMTGKIPPRALERQSGENDPLVPPTKLGAALSPEQEAALLRGLAVQRQDRWQSMGDLYATLYGRTMNGFPRGLSEAEHALPLFEESGTLHAGKTVALFSDENAPLEPETKNPPRSLNVESSGKPNQKHSESSSQRRISKKPITLISAAVVVILLLGIIGVFSLKTGKENTPVASLDIPASTPISEEATADTPTSSEIASQEEGLLTTTENNQPPVFCQVFAGEFTTFFVDNIGGVWTCGASDDGYLLTPSYVSGLKDVVEITCGDFTTALMQDGTVWRSGWNEHTVSIKISGLEHITAIDVKSRGHIALRDDGTVWTWARDPDKTAPNMPECVTNLDHVKKVSTGGSHYLALKDDGTVWAWGWNGYGQLGDGTAEDHAEPLQVLDLDHVVDIGAGSCYSCALREDGTLWVWGGYQDLWAGREYGLPRELSGIEHVVAIAAGTDTVLALKEDGTAWAAWGNNSHGQAGIGNTSTFDIPTQVLIPKKIANLSAGFFHCAALSEDGTVYTWGGNMYGQLGDGTTEDRDVPAEISFTCVES